MTITVSATDGSGKKAKIDVIVSALKNEKPTDSVAPGSASPTVSTAPQPGNTPQGSVIQLGTAKPPVIESDVAAKGSVLGDTTLCADYRESSMKMSNYIENVEADVDFVLYSSEEIGEGKLGDYIVFEDLYNGLVKITMEKTEKTADQPEGFYYRLYSETGFGPGQLYSFTIQKPVTVRLVSAGGKSLLGKDALTLSFRKAALPLPLVR